VSLSRQDTVLGRALLAWGLVERAALVDCANEVRAHAAQGRQLTLGQVLVRRRLLSVERYAAIVAHLRQTVLDASSTSLQAQQATEQLPDLNAQGRYTGRYDRPDQPDESGVRRAVATWHRKAAQVTASGSDLDTVASGTDPAEAEPAAAPVDEKKRPDRPIRRRLEVPPGQERFPIGAWTVEEFVAMGGFGIVYRVTRQGGDATAYALKVLKELSPKPQVRQRFIQEARTMSRLRHPGIVRIHDAGVLEGLLWFVMDFLEGPNLDDVLEEQGPLPVLEARRIIGELCDAVAYAHEQRVLHRDLKPENVLLHGGTRPILTDFGLAKDHEAGLNLTTEGQRLGTPFYMAPEILIDAARATPQTEVYALGAMLYKVLTGDVPFEAKGVMRLIEKLEAGKVPSLRKACPDASRRLDKLCQRALHRKPAKRPQSVAEFAAELASA